MDHLEESARFFWYLITHSQYQETSSPSVRLSQKWGLLRERLVEQERPIHSVNRLSTCLQTIRRETPVQPALLGNWWDRRLTETWLKANRDLETRANGPYPSMRTGSRSRRDHVRLLLHLFLRLPTPALVISLGRCTRKYVITTGMTRLG